MFVDKGWTVGNLIRKLRKEQGITLSQLSNGLCSVTTMNRIETEECVDNILLVSLIIQRLGLSPEKFELYSGKEEFEQLDHRTLIQIYLRDGDLEQAKDELEKYQHKWHTLIETDPLQQQFIKNISGQLAVREGRLQEGITLLEQAIQVSVPEWNRKNKLELVLSEYELLLFNALADAYELSGKEQKAFLMRIQIIEYVNQKQSAKDLKPQLFAEVVCKAVPFLIKQGSITIALELCNQSLSILSNAKRMYCWPDILYLKASCLEKLYKNEASKIDEIVNAYEKSYCVFDLFGEYENADNIKRYLEENYGWELI